MPAPAPVYVFVGDPDPAVAQAIAALAVETIPAQREMVVARCTSVAGARHLLDRLPANAQATVITICASEFRDGLGLDVLSYARMCHPRTRVVLLTNGERDEFVGSLRSGVDGFVPRSEAIAALRDILAFLARDDAAPLAERNGVEGMEFARAVGAMERALDAVERTHRSLARSSAAGTLAARRALSDAEVLAVEAHRRVLEAERRMRAASGGAVVGLGRSES